MKVTFLAADKPLTKSIVVHPNGSHDSTPYPQTVNFTSYTHEIKDIEEFYVSIMAHSIQGHCLLKGNLQREIVNEPRKGLVAPESTNILLLDFDGLDPKHYSVDDILELLDLGGVSYILQYSARQGFKEGLNAHVFVMLREVAAPSKLKLWLKWKNLTQPFFKEQLGLTRTGMALRWPLDITVCQNDKLIYIAPPIIEGGVDPCPKRTVLYTREKGSIILPDVIPIDVESAADEAVRRLRKDRGLPDHKLSVVYSKQDKAEILKNPEKASVTGIKRHGDFTYLNLNNGDSWGYYHPTKSPKILKNFKGEPNYKLEELCPEYFVEALDYLRTLKQEAHKPQDLETDKYWVINRKDEGKYYKVTYDKEEGLTLDPAPSLKHIEDWCMSKNILIPGYIEDWIVGFDPTTLKVIDSDQRRINTFKPTKFRLRTSKRQVYSEDGRDLRQLSADVKQFGISSRALECYIKLIHHFCGSDDEATGRFINWLAYIWQTGKRPKTAWLFHGTYGTGKGRFLKVLQAMFGEHCISINPDSLEDKFNAHLEKAQIVWLDEITTDAWDNEKMTPKLRALIDGEMGMRAMRKEWANMKLYFGMILAANEHNPVEIRKGDRRFNVAPRQEVPLIEMDWATNEMLDDVHGSLYQEQNIQEFADYLMSLEVDEEKVRIPLDNEAKRKVMAVTQNLPEDIVNSLNIGDVSFFLEYVPEPNGVPSADAELYKRVVKKMMEGGKVALRTSDIRQLFSFLAGWNQQPGKFNKAVSKFGLYLSKKNVREGDDVFPGMKFEFKVQDEDKVRWAKLNDSKLYVVKDENIRNG